MKCGKIMTGVTTVIAIVTVASTSLGADNIVASAEKAKKFNTLTSLLKKADLEATLKGDGPFTVFAPTDKAFAKLPAALTSKLTEPRNKERLTEILKFHVLTSRVPLSAALSAKSAETLQGSQVKIRFKDGAVRINDARLQTADITCSNGVIHVIDSVLLPPEKDDSPSNVVSKAIQKGVPMFNAGNVQGCAEIYMAAAKSLTENKGLSESLRKALGGIVTAAEKEGTPKTRAWILRYGLNMVQKESKEHM